MPTLETFGDFRLGEGGLLRRLESACHLTRLFGQLVLVFAVTWLPVVLFGFAHQQITGAREPLLYDASLHVRLLVATPLLLGLDHLFPRVCRSTLRQLVAQAFVPDDQMPRLERLYRKATRLADASLPEIILVLLSLGIGVAGLLGALPIGGLSGGITATRVWYALIAGPVFQFLLWRSLWRWLVWTRILIGLSFIRLRLIPMHPDRCGGINFLRTPSVGYCATLLFVVSSVLCAEWGQRYQVGTTLASFKPLLAMFAVVGALVAFGPLLFFVPHLIRARRDGLVECEALAAENGWRFRRVWIESRERSDLLESRDVQTLASLASLYRDTVDHIRYVLFEKRDVIILLLATLAPIAPVMLIHVPSESWHDLIELLSGTTKLP